MDPEAIVRDFCAAFARQDAEELLGFFADDAVYHNIPFDPSVGKDAIAATLGMFVTGDGEGSFELVHIAANGHVVLTERVDRVTMNGKVATLPVMGTFEVNEAGKITAWRDYFDVAMLMSQVNG
jgi:limonene-1,2-epoxide hydrolase